MIRYYNICKLESQKKNVFLFHHFCLYEWLIFTLISVEHENSFITSELGLAHMFLIISPYLEEKCGFPYMGGLKINSTYRRHCVVSLSKTHY